MLKYEEDLKRDREWALTEGGRYFERQSAVHQSLYEFAQRMDRLQIHYGIIGSLCLFFHGYRRFTDNINVLVTLDSLRRIHAELVGRGYVLNHPNSKTVRDTQRGVRIEFKIAGESAKSGALKSIVYPDPTGVTQRIQDIHCLNLPAILELKIGLWKSNIGRLKELGDVQETIKTLVLARQLGDELHSLVRPIYFQLWDEVQRGRPRQTLRCTTNIPTERINCFEHLFGHANIDEQTLKAMKADGIALDPDCKRDWEVTLFTFDPRVAEKYGMADEQELWDPNSE